LSSAREEKFLENAGMRRAEPAGESGPGENASTCDGSAWRGKGVGDVLQRVLWVVQVSTLVCDLK